MQSRYRWMALVALGLSIFMITVDMSSVALALPAMGQAFQQPDAAMTAVIVSYTLPLTLLILPAGLVITRWPALPTFLVGVLGFAATGALGAFAPSLGWLIGCRVAQSIFGALLAPLGVALAVQVVAPHERGRAMGMLASIGPLGSVAGPGIGGLVLSAWGWPAIFLINVPISIIAAVLALVSIRSVTFARQHMPGMYAIRALFTQAGFGSALLVLWFVAGISGGLLYLLPFALHAVHHMLPAEAGTTLLCLSLGMAMTSPFGGYLTDRYGAQRVLPVGLLCLLIGLLPLTLVVSTPDSGVILPWCLLGLGAANGLIAGPLQTLLLSIGPAATLGAASALSSVARQLGLSCGPLVIGGLWAMQSAAPAPAQMRAGMFVLMGLCLLALVSMGVTLVYLRRAEAPGAIRSSIAEA